MEIGKSEPCACVISRFTSSLNETITMGPSDIEVVLEAVIVAVTDNEPRVLTLRSSNHDGALPGLPSGALDVTHDRTLDRGLRRWIRDQAMDQGSGRDRRGIRGATLHFRGPLQTSSRT